MNPIFEARLSRLFTEQQLDTMKEHMNDQKTAFQNIEIPELVDSLFDSLLLFQLDAIGFIDGEKYKEKDKRSEHYKLLKLIWVVIDVLVHNSCYGIRNEYCCIEYKRQDATMGLLTRQQSKFIRINGAILNDLAAKTNADDTYLIYMEF
ncbi:hypothetical protein CU097_003285 [Rhizopus azygosporus]|uniref:Uncharacterized protein n=1 Tax=Rhizopus azygosporus TaxID=86630 RepID=A0A367J419_RHIAZ|nr:hypothetical protein CU097_003285 [Rhizopus azygosporus]